MIKESVKSKRSKSHTWAPLRWIRFPFFKMEMGMVLYLGEEDEGSLSEGGGQGFPSGRVE
jgi:hypothetical protein